MMVTPACAEPRGEVTVEGFDFAPNTAGPLNFIPPSGVSLQLGNIQTDAKGHFQLTVRLRDANGKVSGTWESPSNPSSTNELVGWHVFDINGATRSVTVFDDAGADPFDDAHPENTNACLP